MSPEMSLGINETKYIGNTKITAERQPESSKTKPGSTAKHEAKHAVAAIANGTGVRMATIVPGPGYLGLTELSRPDAVAAAAPHATGSSGTSHDVMIIGLMGHDVHSASNAAKEIIARKTDEVHAVATILEERGTVTGFEIESAMDKAGKKEEKVAIIIEDLSAGKRTTEKGIAQKGIVIFDKNMLPKAEKEDFDLAA